MTATATSTTTTARSTIDRHHHLRGHRPRHLRRPVGVRIQAAPRHPSSYVTDNTDCDDGNAAVNPAASEQCNSIDDDCDGVDNDCDGTADDDLYKGTGADGSLSVSGTVDLTTDASGARTDADGIAFAVTAIASDTITVDSTVSTAAGDEVLLINLQGSDTAHAAVGTWELFTVDSVSGADVTLLGTVTGTYGESSNTDLTDQTIVLQRVPNYTDVTVAAEVCLPLRVGRRLGRHRGLPGKRHRLHRFGRLHRRRQPGLCRRRDRYIWQLRRLPGRELRRARRWRRRWRVHGLQRVLRPLGQQLRRRRRPHYRGGGEHAGGATDGDSWTGGSATPPYAALPTATPHWPRCSTAPAAAACGMAAPIPPARTPLRWRWRHHPHRSRHNHGRRCRSHHQLWRHHHPPGLGYLDLRGRGGAGGTIWLQADTLTLGSGAVDASGGFGEATHIRHGGDGGEGRVRIDCVTCNGSAWGTASADAALDDMAEPDPGYTEQPE